MLRGPQTLGELRTRTERMVRFSDLSEVQAELDALAARAEPLVLRLARGPGQKEDRYGQLLGGPVTGPVTSVAVRSRRRRRVTAGRLRRARARARCPRAVMDEARHLRTSWRRCVPSWRSLRAEVDALRRALDDLRQQLGA